MKVFLFKSDSDTYSSGQLCAYHEALMASGLYSTITLIPTVQTFPVPLRPSLPLDAFQSSDAVVFTSAKAVEHSSCLSEVNQLKDLMCFVVGPATRRAAEVAGYRRIVFDDTITTAALLKQRLQRESDILRRVFFLCGDNATESDVLKVSPREGGDAPLSVIPIVVYSTKYGISAQDIVKVTVPCWFVLFSSMIASHVYELLYSKLCEEDRRKINVACIGPKTATYCETNLMWRVVAVAAKPSPDGLADAMWAAR